MKLLTFLGVGRYDETTYYWNEIEHTCRFAPVASSYFLKPDELIVFLTEEAEEKIFEEFRNAFQIDIKITPIGIPLGSNQEQLWKIFQQVSSSVQPGEQVAFDITHGLRSFPLVGLLAAAFLRSGLNVDLKAVLYGAYDVGQQISKGRTPMFDLTPMLTQLEWTTAADRFNRTGDARYMASLLVNMRKGLSLKAQSNPQMLTDVGHLGNLAGALTSSSQSLRLIRSYKAMADIHGLAARIEKARPLLEQTAETQPFSLVLQNISDCYSPLAHPNPFDPESLDQTLCVERKMIRWFADREQWAQAVSLAREWLLSWFMVQFHQTDLTNRKLRTKFESVIGAEAEQFRTSKENKQEFVSDFLAQLPMIEEKLELWLQTTEIRNDFLHAGKRENALDPEVLVKQALKRIDEIEKLPLSESCS